MMKKYYNKDATPLKFYKFLRALLPFVALFNLFSFTVVWLYPWLKTPQFYTIPIFYVDAFFQVALLALLFVAAFDIPSMEWRGVRAYSLYWVLAFVIRILEDLYLKHSPYDILVSALSLVMFSVIFLIPYWIYFLKRRPLFTPYPHTPEETSESPVEEVNDSPVEEVILEEEIAPAEEVKESPVCYASTPVEKVKEAPSATIPSPAEEPRANKKRSKQRFCKYCGGKIDIETKKCTNCGKQYFRIPPKKPLPLFLGIFLVLSFGLNVFLFVQWQTLSEENEALNKSVSALTTKNATLRSSLSSCYNHASWVDTSVVFINNKNPKIYHKFGCDLIDHANMKVESASIATNEGVACKECHKSTSKSASERMKEAVTIPPLNIRKK